MEYTITLTTDQDAALKRIAQETEREPQAVIEEQVSFYIKEMLKSEAERQGLNIAGIEEIQTDEKHAEFLARLLNAKEDLLTEMKSE